MSNFEITVSPWMVAFGIAFVATIVFDNAGGIAFLLGIPLTFVATWVLFARLGGDASEDEVTHDE